MNENARRLVGSLICRGLGVSCAESLTGGALTAALVSVPDCSKTLGGAFVTYSSEMKTAILGVDPEVIREHTVVSEPVASQMALGCVRLTGADVGISTTGIAGPGSWDGIPEGRVCFGIYINGSVHTYTRDFGALGRDAVRSAAVDFAIERTLEILSEDD